MRSAPPKPLRTPPHSQVAHNDQRGSSLHTTGGINAEQRMAALRVPSVLYRCNRQDRTGDPVVLGGKDAARDRRSDRRQGARAPDPGSAGRVPWVPTARRRHHWGSSWPHSPNARRSWRGEDVAGTGSKRGGVSFSKRRTHWREKGRSWTSWDASGSPTSVGAVNFLRFQAVAK